MYAASPPEIFVRGFSSGLEGFKGIWNPVQNTAPTGKRVYFPFGHCT
jgi:hypothetical protein